MKRIMIVLAACIASGMFSAGCLSRASSFEASSAPLQQGGFTEMGTEVTGTCTQMQWLFFTFGAAGSPQRHALREALGAVQGTDALISVAVDIEQFAFISTELLPFPVLPVFTTTRVTGGPVKYNAQ